MPLEFYNRQRPHQDVLPDPSCTNMARKKGEQQLKKQGCHRAW